jgi:hypothetical protein
MTVTIDLTPDEERRLQERAAQHGQDLPAYLHQLIRENLDAAPPASSRTLAEVLAPVREDFRKSGMTEEELDDLVEEIREDIWREKHGRPSRSS